MSGKCFLLLSFILLTVGIGAAEPPVRLLVDKVFSRNPSGDLGREDFAAMKRAGFNLVSNRWHGEDPAKTLPYIRLCAEAGLDYLPWLRGTVETGDPAQQLVYENGVRIPIAAPLADALWGRLEQNIVAYAKLSKSYPNLRGVFLDFEIYSKVKYANAYPISYDDATFAAYFRERGETPPQAAPEERLGELRRRGLLDDYFHHVTARFRERCRKLRQAVDRENPAFRFFIYNGDLLVSNEFIPAMHTAAAPVFKALSDTYGPPCPLLPEADNIAMARELFRENRRNAAPDVRLLGGIDPVEVGCIPEFAGKLAVAAADTIDGYWVFYEGFARDSQQHRDYMTHFTLANRAIQNGDRRYADEPFASTAVRKMALPITVPHPSAGVFGGKTHLYRTLREAGVNPMELTMLSPEILAAFDLIVLQNLNVIAPEQSSLHRMLRDYVRNGGTLILAHDTGWFLRGLFPEIAERAYPAHKVSNLRHVLDLEMRVAGGAAEFLRGVPAGSDYRTAFADHAVFQPGREGRTVVENRFGEAVIVAGSVGKGHVVYAGNYFAYGAPLAGTERAVLAGLIETLLHGEAKK